MQLRNLNALGDRLGLTMKRWLFETAEEKDKPLRKVCLLIISAETQTGSEIRSWPIDPDPSATHIPTTVAEILETCGEDSDGLGGVNRYALAAYFGSDTTDGGRSVVFPVHSENPAGGREPGEPGLMPTEMSTERGKDAFAMRHMESAYKLMAGMATEMVGLAMREKIHQQTIIDSLLSKHIDVVMQASELADRKAERDIELRKADMHAKNLERAMDICSTLLPTIVNRVVGFEILKVDRSPIIEQVRLLVGSLNQKQIEKIAEAFAMEGPAQGLAFSTLYDQLGAMTQQIEEEKTKAKEIEAPKAPLSLVKTFP